MRFIIICLLMVSVCYGQTNSDGKYLKTSETISGSVKPVDTLAIPLLSVYDLEKLNVVIMKQFDLTEQSRYNNILKELQRLIAEAKKRKK